MKCIQLNKGQVAIVDDEDFERIAQWRWHVSACGYAVRTVNHVVDGKRTTSTVHMSHEVYGRKPGFEVDHKNGNKLDNRRENLRHATRQEQAFNRPRRSDSTTGFKGVAKNGTGFTARIKNGDTKMNLGTYRTAEEAHAAYVVAATKLHKQFARFN